jgi:hypothetical protein
MDHVVREHVEHYHHERPHQAKGNVPLMMNAPPPLEVTPRDLSWPRRVVLPHTRATAVEPRRAW